MFADKSQDDWQKIIERAFTALPSIRNGDTKSGGTVWAYTPVTFDSASLAGPTHAYLITRPGVNLDADIQRLKVSFRIKAGSMNFDNVASFDGDLSVVASETSTNITVSQVPAPVFITAPVPALSVFPNPVNNALALASFVNLIFVGVLQAIAPRLGDRDVRIRALPAYSSLLLSHVQMAVEVVKAGGGIADVRQIARQLKDHLQKPIDDWDPNGWVGSSFEVVTAGVTVRVLEPTVTTYLDTTSVVMKFDRDVSGGADDHVVLYLTLGLDGKALAITADAYYEDATPQPLIFQSTKQTTDGTEVFDTWQADFRSQSLSGGAPTRTFAQVIVDRVQALLGVLAAHPLRAPSF
jgi:hypothetical protein